MRDLVSTVDAPPAQGRIVIQMGATSSENDVLFISQDHSPDKPIRPAGQPWLLVFNGGLYQSTDRGVRWTRLQRLDRSEVRAQALADLAP